VYVTWNEHFNVTGSPTDRPPFPLIPLDANGQALCPGHTVKVLSVESCASGLPFEDQQRLRGIIGKTRVVVDIDDYGFVWLSFSDEQFADFCVFPRELELV
jgi:hypothetical protein